MNDISAFYVNLSLGASTALEAQSLLESIDNSATYHTLNNLRPALGIYNISTGSVLKKVQQLCLKLEDLFQLVSSISEFNELKEKDDFTQGIVDYIELSLYAASNHVDDLTLIAKHFYQNDKERKRCRDFRKFMSEIKDYKNFITAVTNKIKEFKHEDRYGILHGYIIESVIDGVVGPSPIFHSKERCVFSTTSLVWEIIVFILLTSRSLKTFLKTKKHLHGPLKTNHSQTLKKAILAAVRLPIYQLDEDFPLKKLHLKFVWDESSVKESSSSIYGSLSNPWLPSYSFNLGGMNTQFIADGITNKFNIIVATPRVSLHRLPLQK